MKKLNVNKLKQNIALAARSDLEQNNITGCAYWVSQDNKVLYKNCFGSHPCSEKPIKDNTLFRLASMTKPITAVAALILVDRGQLALSDPITKYLPEFKNIQVTELDGNGNLVSLGQAKNPITIKGLLSHTSGIQGESLKHLKMTATDKIDVDSTVKFLADCGLDFEPESKTQYSSFGAFDVMVKIIEIVSKQDFYEFIKNEILLPCGMSDTVFEPDKEQSARIVPMHKKENGENAIEQMAENCTFEDIPSSHRLGGAGLFSTLCDYSRFAQMLVNGGEIDGLRIISEETLKLLSTPSNDFTIMTGHEKWGLSVRVVCDPRYSDLPVGSFGWSGAYGPHFWIDPENKIAAVFMKNSRFDGGAANASARAFEKAVNNSFIS